MHPTRIAVCRHDCLLLKIGSQKLSDRHREGFRVPSGVRKPPMQGATGGWLWGFRPTADVGAGGGFGRMSRVGCGQAASLRLRGMLSARRRSSLKAQDYHRPCTRALPRSGFVHRKGSFIPSEDQNPPAAIRQFAIHRQRTAVLPQKQRSGGQIARQTLSKRHRHALAACTARSI